MTIISLSGQAQVSGTWSANYTSGTPGYTNLGSGVIQLEQYNANSSAAAGAAITQTSTAYFPCSGTVFSRCYEVYFDCQLNDNMCTTSLPYQDQQGDGASFSFYPSSCNFNNPNTRGGISSGGLGYNGACTQMLTLEFDTYSNMCSTSNLDQYYGGGSNPVGGTNYNDEISLHHDGDEFDTGLVTNTPSTNANAGQLEDGNAHIICITYTPSSHVLNVTIDGNTKFNYDMTGSTYEPCAYFGSTGLYVAWGAGEYGATNNIIVNDLSSTHISSTSYIKRAGCAVLPVSFVSFTGRRSNGGVELDWATASEKNNQGFVIERMDGQGDWQDIGEVAGAGNSDSRVQYSYTDPKPSSSKNYYRLKQVDLNGESAYSNIVDIGDGNGLLISAVPNPFENALTIGLNETGTYTIQVQDMVGRVMYQDIKENTSGSITLSPAIPAGAYLLTVQNGSSIAQQKIIRK
jgi:hypothetical protein